MKGFENVLNVNLGLNPDRLFLIRVTLPENYASDAVVSRFYRSVEDRLSIRRLKASLALAQCAAFVPNYFAVMGILFIGGRVFEERDNVPAPFSADGSSAINR